jgi:RNA polymerase sigma-70 factor (ECF subfamily)
MNPDVVWLDPLPDFYLAKYTIDPAQRQEMVENVTLAFLVALQQLPGRQRAVLLLRDVLDWKASEVADALDMTTAAVNSALQRARTTLKKHEDYEIRGDLTNIADPKLSALLKRYVNAWETADLAKLMALIDDDAKLTMPPLPVWYRGRIDIQAFLQRFIFAGRQSGDFQLIPTSSNGNPAFAVYQRDKVSDYQLGALHILTIQHGQIVQIDDFLAMDQALFSRFDLQFPR